MKIDLSKLELETCIESLKWSLYKMEQIPILDFNNNESCKNFKGGTVYGSYEQKKSRLKPIEDVYTKLLNIKTGGDLI